MKSRMRVGWKHTLRLSIKQDDTKTEGEEPDMLLGKDTEAQYIILSTERLSMQKRNKPNQYLGEREGRKRLSSLIHGNGHSN